MNVLWILLKFVTYIVWLTTPLSILGYTMNMKKYLGLPLVEFETKALLREWLVTNHAVSPGIWIRIFKVASGRVSVSFEDLLDQGLCFGWSESLRHKGDSLSYYQKFIPRKTKGTTSKRNIDHAHALIKKGAMTKAGLDALNIK